MRRRLALVSAAVTSMVVLALVVPLALLVRKQAEDRGLAGAQRSAQAVASALGVAGALQPELTTELVGAVVQASGGSASVSVFLPGGEVVGVEAPITPAVTQARAGFSFTTRSGEGASALTPVLTPGGNLVVQVSVAPAELRRGVATAWLVLAALGLVLVGVALSVADRLARTVVRPVDELADAAYRLAEGKLDTRVTPSGPPEVVEVGEAFNRLAERLGDLLAAERESVADLSHGLRTPLTALRLQAETVSDGDARAGLLIDIDRLEASIDQLIDQARQPQSKRARRTADLREVAAHRIGFWAVVAEDQDRKISVDLGAGPQPVALSPEDLGAAIDTLLENVFSHTAPGIGFSVAVAGDGDLALLVIEDEGPGWQAPGLISRGRSGSGSTGLGLDIVRKAAQRSGGSLALLDRPGGGARVEVRLGRP